MSEEIIYTVPLQRFVDAQRAAGLEPSIERARSLASYVRMEAHRAVEQALSVWVAQERERGQRSRGEVLSPEQVATLLKSEEL